MTFVQPLDGGENGGLSKPVCTPYLHAVMVYVQISGRGRGNSPDTMRAEARRATQAFSARHFLFALRDFFHPYMQSMHTHCGHVPPRCDSRRVGFTHRQMWRHLPQARAVCLSLTETHAALHFNLAILPPVTYPKNANIKIYTCPHPAPRGRACAHKNSFMKKVTNTHATTNEFLPSCERMHTLAFFPSCVPIYTAFALT